jgi:hypothetical protein
MSQLRRAHTFMLFPTLVPLPLPSPPLILSLEVSQQECLLRFQFKHLSPSSTRSALPGKLPVAQLDENSTYFVCS